MGYDLWPRPYRLRSFAGKLMRLHDDVRHCVVFIGNNDGPSDSPFTAKGTGFLVGHKGHNYLATVQHIAAGFGDGPFAIRFNTVDGTARNLHVDPYQHGLKWYCNNSDPDVDLAVMPFGKGMPLAGFRGCFIPSDILVSEATLQKWPIGIGDICYAVGLFRLLVGRKRNLPIVHTGRIALMPCDERLPVQDWHNPNGPRRHIEGYLIELQNLKGLSGSPVFVRPTAEWEGLTLSNGSTEAIAATVRKFFLLGIWQGSWDARPDEVLAVDRGNEIRVPVGMGTVVPATKLIELLELPELQALRAETDARRERDAAASPDRTGVT
jgi:hypothetical protein